MTAPRRPVAILIFACVTLSCLLPHRASVPTPQVANAGAVPGWTGMAPYRPALRWAKTVEARYDSNGCRKACERKGFWGREAYRMVNACKIGCSLGNDYCQ